MKVMLDEGSYLPVKAHGADAGFDLKTPVNLVVPARGSVTVDTGVHILIPEGMCGLMVSKSGLNVKYNISSTGLIDAGYTGSICVKLYNHGDKDVHLAVGNKISQLVILPVATPYLELVTSLPETERGENGFGSSGK